MKRFPRLPIIEAALCAALLAAGAVVPPPLAADVPPPPGISYQGYLTDASGNPVNGTVTMEFALCTDSDCTSPYLLPPLPLVPVVDGVYHVVLDEGGTVPSAFYTGPLWLQVTVDDETLVPPQPFTAVPYAHNADTLDGMDATGFSFSGHNHDGSYSPAAHDHDAAYVNAAGDTMTGTLFLPVNGLSAGGSQLVLSGGNVGIGTSPGSAKLDVLNGAVSGQAAYIRNSSASNSLPAVYASHSGGGQAVFGYNSGTGRAGHFQINNASSAASALVAETNGTGKAAELKGDTLVTGNLTVDGAIGGAGSAAFAASGHNHDSAYLNASGPDTMTGTGTQVLTVTNVNGDSASQGKGVSAASVAGEGTGLEGLATSTYIPSAGLLETTISRKGVYGKALGGSDHNSFYGTTSSAIAYGVYGEAGVTAGDNNAYGVYGKNIPTGNGGVLGGPQSGVSGGGNFYGGYFSSPAEGVYSYSYGQDGTGVRGVATSTSAPTPGPSPYPSVERYGIYGKATGAKATSGSDGAYAVGYGVYGEGTAATGEWSNFGVFGTAEGLYGIAVEGKNVTFGPYGYLGSSSDGVLGRSSATSGTPWGSLGRSTAGVYGFGGTGYAGEFNGDVYVSADLLGDPRVYHSFGGSGGGGTTLLTTTANNIADTNYYFLRGYHGSSEQFNIKGDGSAYFKSLVKAGGSFKIDHPLEPETKYLSHSFVESPDMMNIYNGNVTLDEEGAAWISMPRWFEALNREFRYQLTAVGAPGPNLYVAEKMEGNRFRIAGGSAGMEVSWQVTGVRKDPWAMANRIPVEEDKPDGEVGTYLYPEGYGQAADRQASAGAVTGATP